MTDEELKQLIAELVIENKKTAAQMQETDRHMHETFQEMRENDKKVKKMLAELGKQIGDLGEKFGSFTEGLALPSMRRRLEDVFGMNVISPRHRIRRNGKTLELDVFAYSNGAENKAVIVEVKSHLREEHIERMLTVLKQFREFSPEHASKTLYGILAVVDSPDELRERVLKKGIYYAEVNEDIFEIKVPSDFRALAF